VAVEVTEQVHARHVLQEANRSKDEFLAMLGHELRNPLAPIVSALDLMAAKDEAGAMHRERVIIDRQLNHVIRLVDDLLDISRITRGAIALEQRVLDLGDAVRAALEATKPFVQQRRHRLEVSICDGVNVLADPARLAQVVTNLVTNAAKYTPDAQSIERRDGGLGIGLAIVKNLITLHGGSVAARSAGRGRGSVFSIRLPLTFGPPASMSAPPSVAATASRPFLVVDDNVEAAELLGDLLRAHGHDVTVVHHPDDALACAAELAPQIAVLDIGLPGMDGYELGMRLRALLPGCRMIALTGYGQANDRVRSAAAGFTAHLVKPARIDDLLALIIA